MTLKQDIRNHAKAAYKYGKGNLKLGTEAGRIINAHTLNWNLNVDIQTLDPNLRSYIGTDPLMVLLLSSELTRIDATTNLELPTGEYSVKFNELGTLYTLVQDAYDKEFPAEERKGNREYQNRFTSIKMAVRRKLESALHGAKLDVTHDPNGTVSFTYRPEDTSLEALAKEAFAAFLAEQGDSRKLAELQSVCHRMLVTATKEAAGKTEKEVRELVELSMATLPSDTDKAVQVH